MKMSRPRLHPLAILYFTLLLLPIHLSICNGVSILGPNSLKNTEIDAIPRRVCSQNVGDCLTDPEMDSEINRRVLMMQKRYISYETLKRDMVPCAKAGASYYNCHAGEANPYGRGCEAITRCARDVRDIKT